MCSLAAVWKKVTITNVGSEGYASKLLKATFHFRKVIKTNLEGSVELGRFWAVDTLSCIGTIPPTMLEKLAALHPSFCPGGVNLTDSRRFHLFDDLAKTVVGLRTVPWINRRNLPRGRRLLCFQASLSTGSGSCRIADPRPGPGRAEVEQEPATGGEVPAGGKTASSRGRAHTVSRSRADLEEEEAPPRSLSISLISLCLEFFCFS
jgi:hypothetical protein